MAAKDRVFFCIATSYIYQNRRKFDNSKRLTCVFEVVTSFVLSSDIVCFHQRGVCHNADYEVCVTMQITRCVSQCRLRGVCHNAICAYVQMRP